MKILRDFFKAVSFLTVFNIYNNNIHDDVGAEKLQGSQSQSIDSDLSPCINDINNENCSSSESRSRSMPLSINNISIDTDAGKLQLVKSIKFFPLAGLLIGLIIGVIFYLFKIITEPNIAAVISILFLFIITGGLHFDGLSDTADGLMAFLKTGNREKFFKAMKDVNTGLSGTIVLIFYVLILWVLINDFTSYDRLFALVSFPVAGRYSIVLMSYFSNTPEDFKGIGAIFTEGTDILSFLIASLLSVIIIYLFLKLGGIFALLITSLVILSISFCFSKRFGGVNGDMLGFGVKVSELVYLISLYSFYKVGL
jgi:adenosylcobinamide-GDP ribazoletransferase